MMAFPFFYWDGFAWILEKLLPLILCVAKRKCQLFRIFKIKYFCHKYGISETRKYQ